MTNCIDIYTSVSKRVWEDHNKEIMALSIDKTNYAENNTVTDHNLNIRILKTDLDKIKTYIGPRFIETKELNEDGSHKH